MKEKSVHELKQMLDNGEDFQLVDVREQHEYDSANLNGELIPLKKILVHADKISRDKPVIIHCKSGGRSGVAVNALEQAGGFTNLYNLKGGIMAWKNEIDNSLDVV